MPSLSQLLTDHRSLLVLDAASTKVQVGLLRTGCPALWRTSTEEAGRGIFSCAEALLLESGLSMNEIEAFIFCEGPGSMLGTRTVAMALRTWQVLERRPVFAYQSLALAGSFEWTQNPPRAFAVIADARRETWHLQLVAADGQLSSLQRVAIPDLPAGEWRTPESFRTWAEPPRLAPFCSYDLAKLFHALRDGDFFRPVEAPDAFQHEAPEYKKWSAQIHSLSSADKK